MTDFLASVVDAAEAALALECGADIIDCTDPSRGPLGAPSPAAVAHIVHRVGGARPVSAAAAPPDVEPARLLDAISAMREAGAAIVKIGLASPRDARATISALAPVARDANLVAVFFADRAPQFDLVGALAESGFTGAMLDTVDKTHGRFLQTLESAEAADFIASCRAAGLVSGIAGSLEAPDVPRLVALDPDFLGFRGALCGAGDRRNTLDRDAVMSIRALLDAGAHHDETIEHYDRIFVRDFLIDANIGAYNYERGQSQRMRFNVEADVPRPTRNVDDFRDIVSYDIIVDAIRRLAQSGHIKLVETMAEEIAAATLRDRRVRRVRVRCEKLDIIEGAVGVEIERAQSAQPARARLLARAFDTRGAR